MLELEFMKLIRLMDAYFKSFRFFASERYLYKIVFNNFTTILAEKSCESIVH